MDRKGILSTSERGGGEKGDYRLEEEVLLDDMEGKMKWFQGRKNVYSISSLYMATLDVWGEATISEVIAAISSTYDGIVAPRETISSNGKMLLLSNEETDSL